MSCRNSDSLHRVHTDPVLKRKNSLVSNGSVLEFSPAYSLAEAIDALTRAITENGDLEVFSDPDQSTVVFFFFVNSCFGLYYFRIGASTYKDQIQFAFILIFLMDK